MAFFGIFLRKWSSGGGGKGCLMGFVGFDGRMLFSLLHWHKQARHLLACHGKDHQTIVPTDTSNLVRRKVIHRVKNGAEGQRLVDIQAEGSL
jgi:hypothetical protein